MKNLLQQQQDQNCNYHKLQRNIYYSIALFYYFKNSYKEALLNFEKYYELGKRASCLLFIYACESRLDKLVIKNDDYNHTCLDLYIDYFVKKAKRRNYQHY